LDLQDFSEGLGCAYSDASLNELVAYVAVGFA
jgi:hypothetical protein